MELYINDYQADGVVTTVRTLPERQGWDGHVANGDVRIFAVADEDVSVYIALTKAEALALAADLIRAVNR